MRPTDGPVQLRRSNASLSFVFTQSEFLPVASGTNQAVDPRRLRTIIESVPTGEQEANSFFGLRVVDSFTGGRSIVCLRSSFEKGAIGFDWVTVGSGGVPWLISRPRKKLITQQLPLTGSTRWLRSNRPGLGIPV